MRISINFIKVNGLGSENGIFRLAKKCPYSYNVATSEKRLFSEPVTMKSGFIAKDLTG